SKYKGEKWDWEYLSEFGGFLTKPNKYKEKYLVDKVVKQFQTYIKFDFLSKRQDIEIGSKLILELRDKNWDWHTLSENEKAEISNELILNLQNKNWNWKALSKRKKIEFSNETLLQLAEKDWDWNFLSRNENLEFNTEFIEHTKAKPWNWKAVSRHKSFVPTIELLTLTKELELDWKHLSQHSSLNPTKELLAKFENKWDWQSITENPQINFSDIDFIQRFSDKWNWHFICESGKLKLNKQTLTQFKDHLEWNLISSNTNLDFTKEIIQEFKQFWNWTSLKENKRVEEILGSYVSDEINEDETLMFLDKIEQQYSEWKGYIYHITHIDNAVEIIKNKKIQSRNKANIKGDAAGNVVHRRGDAHDYARFYFRPHTPTQFYNEFLGKNTTDGYNSNQYGWVSWYDRARGLGFPKCPIPIFFKFSLKEVLFKEEKKCCISNGNMQTSSTQFGSIEKMINKFGFDDLYYTPQQYASKEDYNRYRNYAQQEFLVNDELSFDDLSDFEIICPSEQDRILLINLLGKEHNDIFSKIVVDRSYYNNENPRVRIEEEDSELHISTNFNGEGYFVLNGASDIKEMEILVGDVTKTSKDKIIFKSNIFLGNVKQNIQLSFIDESNRNWFVYAK
ncbi:MAG: DarT ssDNA thymidine ADP-ribosyltransferase family protein, partial [Bacteroidaceae bacterium]|nr:DarT ssDNA thymidine ADP-ribosyltransferase family protein [Bacteroidaceae bacterium]